MKTITKLLTVLCLVFMATACRNGEIDAVEKTNKHSNERKNADLIITTPTTLSSNATYGLIEIRNGGNLTITNNAVITCGDFKSTVNHIYSTFVDIQLGSTLSISNYTTSTDINPITTMHVRGTLNNKTMKVFGNVIVYSTGVHNNESNLELYQGQYKVDGGVLNNVNPFQSAVIMGIGGSFVFDNCGKAYADVTSNEIGVNKFSGKGRLKTGRLILYSGTFSNDSRFILCANQYFYEGGSLGTPTANCLQFCVYYP